MLDDYEFALCLTHDVDRVHKSFQCPYYALKERDLSHLKPLFSSENPYWQFEKIMKLEEQLGVRSSFYFLNEKKLFDDKNLVDSLNPKKWNLYIGYYDIEDPEIVDIIKKLDKEGWEIGIHGSYESFQDKKRLEYEKEVLEEITGHQIIGGRQHYLNLDNPKTWEIQRDIGLKYDSSLGSATDFGFQYGYDMKHPFDDDFTVFPVTIMDSTLMDNPYSIKKTWERCEELLKEARKNNAVMTILWHQRCFNEKEFPGYLDIYEKIIQRAQKLGSWVGTVKEAQSKLI